MKLFVRTAMHCRKWTKLSLRRVVLLASFLGMGLGVALGRRRPGLVHYCLPTLALLSLVLAFSRAMGLIDEIQTRPLSS